MRCAPVFMFLFLTIASCRNVPDLQYKSRDFVVLQDSDSALSSNENSGFIRESSGNSCTSDKNSDCKEKEIRRVLPPQMPNLTGFVKDGESTWLQSPYQINHYANAGTLGVGVGSYGGVLYPYAHPNLFAAYNPTIPVSRLPPVSTTHIREAAPYFVPHHYWRPRRRFIRGDAEDDFLDQLTHDAIMINVLPTMPVPMTRSSYGSQVLLSAPAVALYPPNGANGVSCGIPLLLSCSPHISNGVLATRKTYEPAVMNKYRIELPKERKEEGTKPKSSDSEALGLLENLQQ